MQVQIRVISPSDVSSLAGMAIKHGFDSPDASAIRTMVRRMARLLPPSDIHAMIAAIPHECPEEWRGLRLELEASIYSEFGEHGEKSDVQGQ